MACSPVNFARFFDNPDISDFTVRFHGREIKAHRMMLCSRSTVFSKALSPDSPFQESASGVYTIEDDDPDAIEGMLRYIYTLYYPTAPPPLISHLRWEHHLNLAIVADKYDLQQLERGAVKVCVDHLWRCDGDKLDVLNLIRRAEEYHDRDDTVAQYVHHHAEQQFVRLLPNSEFRAWLEERPEQRDEWIAYNFDELIVLRNLLRSNAELALRQLDRQHRGTQKMLTAPLACEHCGAVPQ